MKVDGLFAKWDRPDSPGCAVAVSQHGEIVYLRGYGAADLEHGVPIGPQTVFDVASISKQFTAAAVALLVQDGKLTLEDLVRKYIPQTPAYANLVTIRHLIHHQSGMPEVVDLFNLAGRRDSDVVTREDVMSLLDRHKGLSFEPGRRFEYSNINYIMLGWIVERVSGQSLREFTDERIFQPLGMKNTHFSQNHAEIIRNRAGGYGKDETLGEFRHVLDNQDLVGHSNLWTTVEDLSRWLNNFEESRVGGAAFLDQMLEKAPPIAQGEGMPYAFGLYVDEYRGLHRIWHAGRWRHRSMAAVFPDQGFSVACLCNSQEIDPRPLVLQIADWFLADQIEASVDPDSRSDYVPVSKDELGRYEGTYWSSEHRMAVPVAVSADSLKLTFSFFRDVELRAVGRRRFVEPGFPALPMNVWFEPRSGDSSFDLTITYGGVVYRYEPIGTYTPTPEEIRSYGGAYYSDELDTVIRISIEDGGLFLTRRWQSRPDRLQPILPDVFQCQLGSLTFERDTGGTVASFVMNTNVEVHFKRVEFD